MADRDLAVLERIQRRVLWLSAWMVHHANTARPGDGLKDGGHQASSASVVSLLTALYFKALRPTDVVAVKAHGSARLLRDPVPARPPRRRQSPRAPGVGRP